MNKKQAVAYAQVALNFMQSSKYSGQITPENLGIEMKETFKIYNNNIIIDIAKAQIFAKEKIQNFNNKYDKER